MSSTTLRRLIVIVLIVLWELLPRAGLIPQLFLPSLSSTILAGWSDAGEYGHALAVTLYEIAISMVLACGGVVCAAWAWRTRPWATPAGTAALLSVVCVSWLMPWYVVWVLPLAALGDSARGGMVGDASEYVGKPSLGIDVV